MEDRDPVDLPFLGLSGFATWQYAAWAQKNALAQGSYSVSICFSWLRYP